MDLINHIKAQRNTGSVSLFYLAFFSLPWQCIAGIFLINAPSNIISNHGKMTFLL